MSHPTRRDFIRATGVATLATPLIHAAPTPKSAAETTVKAFHASLSDEQKKAICLPFDHELRTRINANWKITKPNIGSDFYTTDQRKMLDDIVKKVTSEDGYGRFQEQMGTDSGGFENYHVAVFGTPGEGKFEWELTGRHLTLRADGDSVDKMAFGGPLVYGHGVSSPTRNLFHYQTEAANEVFKALEGKQRDAALLAKEPRENMVPIQGATGKFPGVKVGDMSKDQKQLVEKVLKVILNPYRTEDVEESMSILKAGGGLDSLHMAFYKTGDLRNDGEWDVWRVEGPSFVTHFRGAPHVHAYIHIGTKQDS